MWARKTNKEGGYIILKLKNDHIYHIDWYLMVTKENSNSTLQKRMKDQGLLLTWWWSLYFFFNLIIFIVLVKLNGPRSHHPIRFMSVVHPTNTITSLYCYLFPFIYSFLRYPFFIFFGPYPNPSAPKILLPENDFTLNNINISIHLNKFYYIKKKLLHLLCFSWRILQFWFRPQHVCFKIRPRTRV